MSALRRLLLAALVVAALPNAASAAQGWVTGRLQFYQNQGNFCPASRSCTGARYLQSQFNVNSPVGDTRVYIRRNADNVIIGQGVTDANGDFNIFWLNNFTDYNGVMANLIWVGEHRDGRFAIRDPNGNQYNFWTGSFFLNPFTTTNLGSFTWGGPGAPNALANVYDGAWRMWTYALGTSSRMATYFTNVQIRAFVNDPSCATSCADGANKRVRLDMNAAYAPQARVMHEMGHIASYLASYGQSFRSMTDYCFPGTGGTGCGWSLDSAEWSGAGFEEGLATFLGDASLYAPDALQPHTCFMSQAACTTLSFDIEQSGRDNCPVDENRRPISVTRYLWDIYDSRQDIWRRIYPIATYENLQRSYGDIIDTIGYFPNGTGNNQKDEPWSGPGGTLADRDGRSARDFRAVMAAVGTESQLQLDFNCRPAGD